MSAIEVLKNYWKYVHSKDTLDFDSEFHNAINEALLALEQKEKLVEWLEKEIVFCNEKICDKDLEEVSKLHFASYKMGLKMVLERVGEQK